MFVCLRVGMTVYTAVSVRVLVGCEGRWVCFFWSGVCVGVHCVCAREVLEPGPLLAYADHTRECNERVQGRYQTVA